MEANIGQKNKCDARTQKKRKDQQKPASSFQPSGSSILHRATQK